MTIQALRPKSFRGDQVAAGVVVLTVLVALLGIRFDDRWDPVAHAVYSALALALVMAMAVLSPLESPTPRAFQTVLYVASFVLAVLALSWLAVALDGSARFAVVWAAAALSAQQGLFAIRRRSPTATLLCSVSGSVAVVAVVAWISDDDLEAIRWALALVLVANALLAVGQRDRRPAHAGQLANAGGLAALAIAATGGLEPVLDLFAVGDRFDSGVGWGWELLVLAAGFGLVSYGAVDRERGPAVLGVVDLAAFVALAAFEDSGPSLIGWPLALVIAAAVMLVLGLRPTTPAPPPPDLDHPPAGAVPLPRRDEPEL